jgi:LEA14-like dessication related protein
VEERSQRMRKKSFVLIVLVLAIAHFSSPASLDKDLKLEVREKGVRDFSLEGLTVVFYVNIANSSSNTYYLSGYEYRFLVDQKDYLQLRTGLEEGLLIKPKDETLIAFPVKITYENLFRVLPEVEKELRAACNLVGWAWFSDGRRDRGKLPLAFSGEFPIFKKPEVDFVRLRVKTLTIGGADIEFEIKVENKNRFELLVDRISYNLTLGEHPIREGTIAGDKNIEKQGEKIFALPFLLDFFDVGKGIYDLLQQPSASCLFSGEVEVQTVWGRLTIPFEKRGAVPIDRNP